METVEQSGRRRERQKWCIDRVTGAYRPLFLARAFRSFSYHARTILAFSMWSSLSVMPLLMIIIFLRDSTHPSQHPHFIHLKSIFLAFRCWPCICAMHQFWPCHCSVYLPFSLSGIFLSHNTPLHLFQFPHAAVTLRLISITHTSVLPHHCRQVLEFDHCFWYTYSHSSIFQRFSPWFYRYSVISSSLPPQCTILSANIIVSGNAHITFSVRTSVTIMNIEWA